MTLLPTTAPELRDYQRAAVEQIESATAESARAPLLVMPTGSGKTVVACELIRRAERALFLAPRRELIHQASRALAACGVDHGVHLAGADHLRQTYARVQLASIDTLLARMVRRQKLVLPNFDLVVVDEAHLSITERRQRLLDHWPDALRVGLTATPTRKDGKALGALYDRLIEPTTTAALVQQGYLVPGRYFSVSEPDLSRVRTVAGDYHQRQLAEAVNRAELVGDVVEHWLRHAGDRRTAVFCVSIEHAAHAADEFLRAGVSAEHVSADTPQAMREATFERFERGDTQVLCNVQLASYGFDLPALSCIVLARPTKSLMLYLQMLGRGLRPADGKPDCLVLDHSGCVHRFGFAEDERAWTLEGDMALATPPESRATGEVADAKRVECPECAAVFSRSRVCPECGYYLAPKGKEVETLDGELIEVGAHLNAEQQDRLAFYLELRGIARERGYKPAWAAHQYRERFGAFPPWAWNDHGEAQPTMATRRWVKSRLIAFRKAQQAKAQRPTG